ncbi:DUF2064 domain-containing protein [Oryzobacter terrae]|uniref:TIGR04282 family arsenosugar biosynthesis glycosyltransferase n=1 Tax=Oryzobacter terrae TaxID=1620385 RepID=UPI00366BE7F5
MAKVPVPGMAKTRLAPVAGDQGAADLAAAALLDTLAAGSEAFPPGRRVLALTGDLAAGCRADELARACRGWLVVAQGGQTFGQRLVDGHRQAHRREGGPVVQIGMDTPQVGAELLREVAEAAYRYGGPVLGPADDGGWWVLATTHAREAAVLDGVPMSRPDTGRLTAAALSGAGHPPIFTVTLRDVDLPDDARVVAEQAPSTRFAATWRAMAAGALGGAPTTTSLGSAS